MRRRLTYSVRSFLVATALLGIVLAIYIQPRYRQHRFDRIASRLAERDIWLTGSYDDAELRLFQPQGRGVSIRDADITNIENAGVISSISYDLRLRLPLGRLKQIFSMRGVTSVNLHGEIGDSDTKRIALILQCAPGLSAVVLAIDDVEPRIINALSSHQKIRSLTLDHCKAQTGAWSFDARFSALNVLRITGSPLRSVTVKGLERLEKLDLGTAAGDEDNGAYAIVVEDLPCLQVLTVDMTNRQGTWEIRRCPRVVKCELQSVEINGDKLTRMADESSLLRDLRINDLGLDGFASASAGRCSLECTGSRSCRWLPLRLVVVF